MRDPGSPFVYILESWNTLSPGYNALNVIRFPDLPLQENLFNPRCHLVIELLCLLLFLLGNRFGFQGDLLKTHPPPLLPHISGGLVVPGRDGDIIKALSKMVKG